MDKRKGTKGKTVVDRTQRRNDVIKWSCSLCNVS